MKTIIIIAIIVVIVIAFIVYQLLKCTSPEAFKIFKKDKPEYDHDFEIKNQRNDPDL